MQEEEKEALKIVLVTWFETMQECVRTVDYERAKRIFSPAVVGFGTYQSMVVGLEALAEGQWGNIWPTIRDFTFRTEQMYWDADGKVAWAACPWDSLGFNPDGTTFSRPGRATITFRQQHDGNWLATHSHFSLYPRPTS